MACDGALKIVKAAKRDGSYNRTPICQRCGLRTYTGVPETQKHVSQAEGIVCVHKNRLGQCIYTGFMIMDICDSILYKEYCADNVAAQREAERAAELAFGK